MIGPLTNGSNGRDTTGKFAKGNPGGPGNPHAARVAQLRSLMLEAVSLEDIQQVVAKLIELAKGGDLAAIRELLDRTLGKPTAALTLEMSVEESLDSLSNSERMDRVKEYASRLEIHIDPYEAARASREAIMNDLEYVDYLRDKQMEKQKLNQEKHS